MGSNLPQGKERLPKDHAAFGWLDLRIVSIRTVDRGLRIKSTTRSIIQIQTGISSRLRHLGLLVEVFLELHEQPTDLGGIAQFPDRVVDASILQFENIFQLLWL